MVSRMNRMNGVKAEKMDWADFEMYEGRERTGGGLVRLNKNGLRGGDNMCSSDEGYNRRSLVYARHKQYL
jgi:hypothetical protein